MGWETVTLNWHMIAHWESVVKTHGPVRRYWAWVMERLNKKFKNLIYTTNFKNVEIEAVKRYERLVTYSQQLKLPMWGPPIDDGDEDNEDYAPIGTKLATAPIPLQSIEKYLPKNFGILLRLPNNLLTNNKPNNNNNKIW